MDDTTKQLLYDARLIIANHHDGFGDSMVLDACSLRQRALKMIGINGTQHNEDTWDENIGNLPDSIRDTMIQLDDALDMHRFC
jgi:hypothetical protein